ncbi:Peptidase M48, partial [Corchorus capsularis]
MAARAVQCPTLPGECGAQERGATVEKEEKAEEEEGSPSIKLGLGVDGKVSEKEKKGGVIVLTRGKCEFTKAQLRELRSQGVIYEHIARGSPVPLHLVMPIWKSVASSFDSAQGSIYEHYPSFVGVSPQGFDYSNMMDPEPGRCRRTDGKKWRCSKNVIPDQKYCEQHMHRGRHCSRKPVESPQITLPDENVSDNSNKESENSNKLSAPVSVPCMNQPSCNSSPSKVVTATTAIEDGCKVDSKRKIISTPATTVTATKHDKENDCKRSKNLPNASDKGEEKLSIGDNNITQRSSKSGTAVFSAPVSVPCMKQSSCNSSPSKVVTAATAMEDGCKVHSKRKIISPPATTISTTIITATKHDKKNDCKRSKNLPNASDKGEEKLSTGDNNITQRSSKSGTAVGNRPSSGVDISPKSVLQVTGSNSSSVDKNEIELEPGRCRRTDGKKWRCSRAVIPDQKYCARHMNRGARKPVEVSQPVVDSSTSRLKKANKVVCAAATAVTTNLSISIPSQELSTHDESRTMVGAARRLQYPRGFLQGTRRFYHSNPNNLPLPRTLTSLVQVSTNSLTTIRASRDWRAVLFTVAAGSCLLFMFGVRIERVPYSNRFHFTLSNRLTNKLGSYKFGKLLANEHEFEHTDSVTVHSSDPCAIRVQSIARKLLEGMHKGLMLQNQPVIVAPKSQVNHHHKLWCKRKSHQYHLEAAAKSGESEGLVAANQKGQNCKRKLLWKPSAKHLEGKAWQVYVTDSYSGTALCLLNGKVVIGTRLLEDLKSDDEVAAVIAHEIAHTVARHLGE